MWAGLLCWLVFVVCICILLEQIESVCLQVEESTKRQRVGSQSDEPTVEEIEAEFWRIIETPDEVRSPKS